MNTLRYCPYRVGPLPTGKEQPCNRHLWRVQKTAREEFDRRIVVVRYYRCEHCGEHRKTLEQELPRR